jgi:hypothetical protein
MGGYYQLRNIALHQRPRAAHIRWTRSRGLTKPAPARAGRLCIMKEAQPHAIHTHAGTNARADARLINEAGIPGVVLMEHAQQA